MENSQLKTIKEKVSSKDKDGLKPRFLDQLYNLLEENRYGHLICWSPDGQSIVIQDKVLFAEQVLANVFNHKNFSSFVRQLHMYNFKRVRDSGQVCCYSNSSFKRGQRNLLDEIKRRKASQNSTNVPVENSVQASTDMDRLRTLETENELLRMREQMATTQLKEAQMQIGYLEARNKFLEENLMRRCLMTAQRRPNFVPYRDNHVPMFTNYIQNPNSEPIRDSLPNQNMDFTRLPPFVEEDRAMYAQSASNLYPNFQNVDEMRQMFSNQPDFNGFNRRNFSDGVDDFFGEETASHTDDQIGLNTTFQGQSRPPF